MDAANRMLSVLVVEDEEIAAEAHAEYVRRLVRAS